jgi:probable addiction module antidote protein
MKKTKKRQHGDYRKYLLEKLQDPKMALGYLNEALQDEDQRVFLLALKDVLAAQGGDITALAEQASLNRQNMYRMLSTKGNPRWDSITSLFNALGYQIKLSIKK